MQARNFLTNLSPKPGLTYNSDWDTYSTLSNFAVASS